MSAIRLPLLCAFAGGCLSSAVLFGLWRADAGAGAAGRQAPRNVERVAPVVTSAAMAQSAEQPHDLYAGVAAEHVRSGAGEPAPPATQAVDGENHEPAGSAVSDVLTNLEAAYRARVAATAPARAPATLELAVAAPRADIANAATEPSPPSASQPVAAVVAVIPAPPVAPTPAPASVVAAAPVATAAVPPPTAAPAFVAEADARPTEVHIGDVNQNTYITNVRQGDVYLIQMQQLAMLQYMQLLGMSSGVAAPAQHVRGTRPQSAAFPSTITNPDNPWGFHFSPPNLVH